MAQGSGAGRMNGMEWLGVVILPFVVVALGALAFFAFVIGSGLTGAVGQSVFGLLFGIALLTYVWRRLDAETRARFVAQTRRALHRSPAQP